MVKTPNLMGMLLNITLNNNGKRGAPVNAIEDLVE